MVNKVCQKLDISERRACKVLGQSRATQRYVLKCDDEEKHLRNDIIQLASKYGRYGYRRITAILNNNEGWKVNHKRVERIWREEGLKVPQKQPKRGRLWLNDGSCIRLRPEHKDHVWSYDFIESRTTDGRRFRVLNIIDEYTRECLACVVGRSLKTDDVINALFNLFVLRAMPRYIRSDNGSEFTAKAIRKWLDTVDNSHTSTPNQMATQRI